MSARAVLLLGLIVVALAISALGRIDRAQAEPAGGTAPAAKGCPYGTDDDPSTKPPGDIQKLDGDPPLTVICGSDGHWHRVVRAQLSPSALPVIVLPAHPVWVASP